MTAPDLTNPEEKAAYKRELRGVARWQRGVGFGFIGIGALMVLARASGWAIWASEGPDLFALAILAVGWGFLVWAMLLRTAYHRRRMSETEA